MSFTFGNRPEDVVTDSKGNTLSGVTNTFYATEADANARTSPLGSATSTDGAWSFTSDLPLIWARTPAGKVYPISSAEASVADFTDQVNAAKDSAAVSATSAATAAAAAASAQTAAQNAAGLVGAPADAAIAAAVSNPASATAGVLNSTIAAAVAPKLDASKVKITDGGEAAGVGTGGPTRPNLQLGGVLNGTTVEPSQIHGVILQPGGPGYNNIIGGDGSATVNTSTPNTADASAGNCGVSLIGGYDNVSGQISSKIISDHSYTEKAPAGNTAPGHNLIMGGHGHVIRWAASHSAVVGGESLDVGGSDSLTTGFENVNNGASSLVSGASNTLAVSSGSTVGGQLNNVQSSYARVTGYSNVVDAVALFAEMHGANGKARSPFLTVRSAGQISAQGDAQNVAAQYRGQSTSATAILLIAAYTGVGSNSQYLMVQGQSALIKAEVVARIVGGATVGAWTFQGVAQWQTGAGAPVWLGGTPAATALYTNGSGAAPVLLLGAGGSAGRVFVQCAGVAATTINWSCKFTAVEVMA